MVRRGVLRATGASFAALLALSFGGSAVMAAEADCSVQVAPKAGPAGTVFVFSGAGFEPTNLVLHKDDSDAGSHKIDTDEDPWEVSVRSRPGDEGEWAAELSSEDCSASATFTVTLSNTDAASDAAKARSGQSPMPIGLWLGVIVAGLGGGLFVGRRLNAVAVHNRSR